MLRRHEHFPCNDTTAERWLHHSQIAFEQVGSRSVCEGQELALHAATHLGAGTELPPE